MKKIILAFDSFKGSAGSLDIARYARQAIRKELPYCEVLEFPVADGGEGTTEAICTALEVNKIFCEVHDPLMNPVEVSYGITKDGATAILEMASASGLPLVAFPLRNPMNTTSYGTGEVILDALNRGCRQFIVGLGGSATNDAGMGILSALGIRFFEKSGERLEPKGSNLAAIEFIDETFVHPALKEATFTMACDVHNPFYGLQGAAYVFAPQKGATPDHVISLDEGLRHYAEVIKRQKQMDIAFIPGAGIDVILDILHFREALQGADLIFTGEGKLDAQTGMGKALGGILKEARKENVPVIALGGGVEATEQLNKMGFTAVLSIQPAPVSLDKAMQQKFTLDNVERTVTQLIRIIKQFSLNQK